MSVKSVKFVLILLCFCHYCMAQMTIVPVFGDKPITKNTWFITKNKDSIQLDNIRFYLSNIQFEMDDKTVVRDSAKAHLIDVFEPNSLQIAVQKIDLKHIQTLRFNIGIDSLTNVAGALGGDLDPQKGMYWAWQSGYINLKIEGRSPQSKSRKNVFQYHIGGYLPPFYAMKHVELPVSDVGFMMSDVGTSPKSPIRNPKYTEGVALKIDFSKLFENISIATQNNIMMPCKEAVQLAEWSVQMFSITKNEK